DGSILRRALEMQDADLLFKSIWTLDPGQSGYRLWRQLDDRDWQDLIQLMDTYRRIRVTAADSGARIWG
ncbi:MAG: chromosome partitioning protein ParB, partial [Gammaproteobacteria bacterium]|nr:chromosome partitioning protein ParB [Gammaproteobacteria bacterium]